MKKFFTISFITLFMVTHSYSAIINSRSGSRNDIQAAVNKAETDDVVQIPAGEFQFNGSVSLKAGITIRGEGKNKTILHRSGSSTSFAFVVDGSNKKRVRFSGFTMYGRSPGDAPAIRLNRACKDFRIDNISFRDMHPKALEIHDNARGVIDHCDFIQVTSTAIVIYGDEDVWKEPYKLGTENAIFIEDCFFRQTKAPNPKRCHHIASNNGSKYVFRYNVMEDGDLESHSVDAHGNKYYWPRGSRSYEIYNNTLDAVHRWAGINIRGGDGVVFNNVMKGDIVSPIHLMWEGKKSCSYPCVDQIRDLYMWNNTYNGKEAPVHNRHTSLIKNGRDYHMEKKRGYTPFTYPHPLTLDSGERLQPTGILEDTQTRQQLKTNMVVLSNPFTPSSTIRYTIGSKNDLASVKISIYDSKGRVVRRLFDGTQGAGNYEITWNGRDAVNNECAKGMYLVRLSIGANRYTGRIIIAQ